MISEYVVMILNGGSKISTESVDVNATCVPPSFNVSGTILAFYKFGADFYAIFLDTDMVTMKLQTNGSWQAIKASDEYFPVQSYELVHSKSRGLLAIGGLYINGSAMTSDRIYQLTNGAWTKMSLKLKDAIQVGGVGCALITDDDTKLITVGGLNHQNQDYKFLQVYEIADGSVSGTASLEMGALKSCTLVNNVVYFEDYIGKFFSYDVAKANFSEIAHPNIKGGSLANFRGKAALLGGGGMTNSGPSKVIKVFENGNWDTEIPFDSSDVGNAAYVTVINK